MASIDFCLNGQRPIKWSLHLSRQERSYKLPLCGFVIAILSFFYLFQCIYIPPFFCHETQGTIPARPRSAYIQLGCCFICFQTISWNLHVFPITQREKNQIWNLIHIYLVGGLIKQNATFFGINVDKIWCLFSIMCLQIMSSLNILTIDITENVHISI